MKIVTIIFCTIGFLFFLLKAVVLTFRIKSLERFPSLSEKVSRRQIIIYSLLVAIVLLKIVLDKI